MSVRPVLIRSEDQLVGLLRGRREAMRLSHVEVDDRVGWAEGYASKIEAPHRRYGRRLFIFLTDLADELLQALGLALVLMDRADAERLCAESAEPDMATAVPLAYPNRQRAGGLVQERRVRLSLTFRRAA